MMYKPEDPMFIYWKNNQLKYGNLTHSIRKPRCDGKTFTYPYGSKCVWATKYRDISRNDRSKNKLTFDEYLYKVYEANITPDDIGFAMDKYQLCRYDDDSDYLLDTCRYAKVKVNMNERDTNGGTAVGAKKRTGSGNGMYGNKRYTGTNGSRWCGVYHTPFGVYTTALEASKKCGLSITTINRYCKHQSRSKDSSVAQENKNKLIEEGWWFEKRK